MFKKTLIAALLAVAATGSFAQYYVQGAIGKGNISVDCGTTACDKSNTGNKFAVGYELGNGWSVEGLMINYGKVTASGGEAKLNGLGIGGAYTYPINDMFSVKGGLSIGSNKVSAAGQSKSAMLPNYTLGFAYKINDSLSAVAEFDSSKWKIDSFSSGASLLSFGIRAKF